MNVPLNYNGKLNQFARNNRKQTNMTKAEGLLRNSALKNKTLGYRFIKQKIIGNYILDFYCAKLKLCIEIDDQSHDRKGEKDGIRIEYLNSLGIKVIRYTNNQIYYQLDGVVEDLHEQLKERKLEVI